MIDRHRVVDAVFSALEEIDAIRNGAAPIAKSEDTLLFGEGGELESLELVSLIIATETNVARAFDATITIADERAMSARHSPFRSVRSLVDYVTTLLSES
ncbi:MAG TPA: hypothetical protein VMU84_21105 [Thermoanaerobaculia bacterium]|nr:hypothetical protein [Thermoanaerobaculia bacterium]